MRVDELELLQANVTIVYETLSINDIVLDPLRAIWPDEPPQMLTEVHDLLVVVYPARALTIQAGEKRLRILCLQGRAFNPEDLAHATYVAAKAVKQERVIAFGLNYLTEIKLALREGQTSTGYLISRYLRDIATLAKRGGGRLVGTGLLFAFQREKGRFQIHLSPTGPTTVRADTNLHFDMKDIPPAAELATLLADGLQEVTARIEKL